VVETADAVLVTDRQCAQDVKKVVASLGSSKSLVDQSGEGEAQPIALPVLRQRACGRPHVLGEVRDTLVDPSPRLTTAKLVRYGESDGSAHVR